MAKRQFSKPVKSAKLVCVTAATVSGAHVVHKQGQVID